MATAWTPNLNDPNAWGYWKTPEGQQAQQTPYGTDPYAGYQGQVSGLLGQNTGWTNQLMGNLMKSPWLTGGGGAGGTWNTGAYPAPGSPLTQGYMRDIEGSQLRDMNQYARMSRPTAMRGGGVVGGMDPQMTQMQAIMDKIAGGRAGLYDTAMRYGREGAQLGLQGWGQAADLAKALLGGQTGLLGLGLQGRQAEQGRYSDIGNWRNQLSNTQLGTWNQDVNWARDARNRAWEDKQRQWQGTDRERAWTEKQGQGMNLANILNEIQGIYSRPTQGDATISALNRLGQLEKMQYAAYGWKPGQGTTGKGGGGITSYDPILQSSLASAQMSKADLAGEQAEWMRANPTRWQYPNG